MKMIKRVMILSFILISLLFAVQIITASPERYYAGYYYYGTAGYPPPNGVSADIYTINKEVSGENFYAQWPCVILSYAYKYWVQVGYNKGYDSNYQLLWYVEKQDINGYQIIWYKKDSPLSGITYHYYLYQPRGTTIWRAGVTGYFEQELEVSPYTARDYQAFSETTTQSINIDGTHFLYISYAKGSDWYLWDRHLSRADNPYWVKEISDYEFKAGGGE